jgi:hypothetical protein
VVSERTVKAVEFVQLVLLVEKHERQVREVNVDATEVRV